VRCHRNSQRLRPETVSLAADTTFGSDVTIEPFVVIGPGVSIADGAVIHSFSHVVQASIGKKAQNNQRGRGGEVSRDEDAGEGCEEGLSGGPVELSA
jgi:acyl-[acyl carrier protein]--UDP-N-acetylglucosamine O-acyltransferase